VVISDHDKGLIKGIAVLRPRVKAAHCYLHLLANFKKAGFGAFQKAFWSIARATTPAQFKAKLNELGGVSAGVAIWLCRLDKEKWALAHLPLPRFGHDTSNVVESQNQALL
jgi:hypothetical protein